MLGFLLASELLMGAALPAPPDVTIQIADRKDGSGNWASWTEFEVVWDENVVPEVPPHSPTDDDVWQDWCLPIDGEFFHFWFIREEIGLYAVRWCYGEPSADSLWSPFAECTVVASEQGGDQQHPPQNLGDPSGSAGSGETRTVEFPMSIQGAIDAARNGDTIIVAPGKYVENINFKGKAITVRSQNPEDTKVVASTIIDGGGVASVVTFNSNEGESSVLSGFTITNGRGEWGGGVQCAVWTVPTVRNNRIVGNTALRGGGGIYCAYSATATRNIIAFNHSQFEGGGIWAEVSSWPLITSNFIYRNQAATYGGGIFCHSFCVGRFVNNTIADNSASLGGGGIYAAFASSPDIWNCILWGNGDDLLGWGAANSCIEDVGGENEGPGNIHLNPLFVNPALEDYHILASSPCIGAGTLSAPSMPVRDFDGETIPASLKADIGADEFLDTDSDDLADLWEKKWFGNLSKSAGDDPDHDQLANENEVVAGTDPMNPDTDGDSCLDGVEFFADTDPMDPESLFEILALSGPSFNATLRWSTVPGRWYQPRYSDNLTTWTSLGQPLRASGATLQVTVTLPAKVARRFFRVDVLPPT